MNLLWRFIEQRFPIEALVLLLARRASRDESFRECVSWPVRLGGLEYRVTVHRHNGE